MHSLIQFDPEEETTKGSIIFSTEKRALSPILKKEKNIFSTENFAINYPKKVELKSLKNIPTIPFFRKKRELGKNYSNDSIKSNDSGGKKKMNLKLTSPFYINNSNNNRENKKKPLILDESKTRYTGILKYYDDLKNYGFIKVNDLNTEIFFHYDDIVNENITNDFLTSYRNGNIIKMSFAAMTYIGKYNESRKAIEICIM